MKLRPAIPLGVQGQARARSQAVEESRGDPAGPTSAILWASVAVQIPESWIQKVAVSLPGATREQLATSGRPRASKRQ